MRWTIGACSVVLKSTWRAEKDRSDSSTGGVLQSRAVRVESPPEKPGRSSRFKRGAAASDRLARFAGSRSGVFARSEGTVKEDRPMTTPIPYDDFRPDLWVTIRDVPEDDPSVSPFDTPEETLGRLRRRRRPVARPGIPLRILSVDLPFLYLAVLDGDGDEVGPVILDVRDQPVVGIDESVPHAIIAFGWRKREDAQSRCTEAAGRAAEVETAAEVARLRSQAEAGLEPGEEEAPGRRRRRDRHDRDERRRHGRCGDSLVSEVRRIMGDEGDDDDDGNDGSGI